MIRKLKIKAKVQEPKEEPRKKKKRSENTLPSDEYKPIFEPVRKLVRECKSYKDGTPMKDYLEISVKRWGEEDTDEAMPYMYIQMYRESSSYTGYLSGKTIYFPLERFDDVIEVLFALAQKCEEERVE